MVKIKFWPTFFSSELDAWLDLNMGKNLGVQVSDWSLTFGIAVWYIWKWRNDFAFGDGSKFRADPVMEIMSHTKQMQEALTNQLVKGWYMLNVDASVSLDNRSIATCGGLIRDNEGLFCMGFNKYLGSCNALHAETWGILHGLEVAWNAGYRRIIVETDSKDVVENISKRNMEMHQSSQLVRKVRNLMQRNWDVKIRHEYREANEVAHRLASLARIGADTIVFNEAPGPILPLLFKDQMGSGSFRSVVA
ncbi:Ribonuclease H protein [Senna tora]|uniref:Ribonuclease H protein n=1 Tax=Senna tora TaxID=362788 RepID=A0A834WZC4_9FABA|nr:Ribonuclease H protein [Senna tora]